MLSKSWTRHLCVHKISYLKYLLIIVAEGIDKARVPNFIKIHDHVSDQARPNNSKNTDNVVQ